MVPKSVRRFSEKIMPKWCGLEESNPLGNAWKARDQPMTQVREQENWRRVVSTIHMRCRTARLANGARAPAG